MPWCKLNEFSQAQRPLFSTVLCKCMPAFSILAADKWNSASPDSTLGQNPFLRSLPCSDLCNPCPNMHVLTTAHAYPVRPCEHQLQPSCTLSQHGSVHFLNCLQARPDFQGSISRAGFSGSVLNLLLIEQQVVFQEFLLSEYQTSNAQTQLLRITNMPCSLFLFKTKCIETERKSRQTDRDVYSTVSLFPNACCNQTCVTPK